MKSSLFDLLMVAAIVFTWAALAGFAEAYRWHP